MSRSGVNVGARITMLSAPLGCPRCKGPLSDVQGYISCESCGKVGSETLGVFDFLHDVTTLAMAAGGTFDLIEDAEKAKRLLERGVGLSFSELLEAQSKDGPREPVSRASRRFAVRYWQTCNEVGFNHGGAILAKVNAVLSHQARPHVYPGVAVEAGGGQGFYIPDFARYFSDLIFIDCSLQNLVLARRLAEDLAIGNVTYVRADVTALPLQPHSADMIHGNGVIEHVADPKGMVKEALRALSPRGTYICLSPNRYPISPDPHFRLPLYGLFPSRLRHSLVRWTRGLSDEVGTDLLSLRQLRGCFEAAVTADVSFFFLPPKLPSTARSGAVRRFVRFLLNARPTGFVVDLILNKMLLWIAPYHIAIKCNIPRSRLDAKR